MTISQPTRISPQPKDFDYSTAGAYFLTLCTHQKTCIFGNVIDGKMYSNALGKIVLEEWSELEETYFKLDAFILMPNHVHGVVWLKGLSQKTNLLFQPKPNITKLISRFKMRSAKRINELQGRQDQPLWQRGYWDRVVRDETELTHIREYIKHNPKKWALDRLRPR
ncbi:transposase [Salinispirillum marinum]|uniref:Transposase n=2 Tax=Saccharospirillaceae TaxID=255527 RepID=A0ABV8BEB0_9GAMM